MALIDTEGRTQRERVGKGRAFTEEKKSGKLKFSSHGLAPRDDHTGCWNPTGPAGKRQISDPSSDSRSGATGKRAIRMEHQLYSDARKRQLGKIGLRKLKPFVEESEKPRGKSGSDVRGLTSEQRAALNIKKITHKDPSDLGISEGPQLFTLEQKIQREARVKEATAQMEEFKSRQRSPNRAPPSAESKVTSPFNTKEVPKHVPFRKPCADPPSATADKKKQGRSVDPVRYQGIPTPYDTVDSTRPYPDPPAVGQRGDPFAGRGKAGVQGQKQCGSDLDSVARKRAEARPNIAPPERPDNVIFGNPSPERKASGVAVSSKNNRGVGFSLLEHSPQSGSQTARPGMRMSMRHKPTSLW